MKRALEGAFEGALKTGPANAFAGGMRTRRFAPICPALATLTLCIGCGGRAEGPDREGVGTVDSGAADGSPSGSPDASPGRPPVQPPLGPDCPTSIPTQNSPCSHDAIRC